MKKTICDFCGKDITAGPKVSVAIFKDDEDQLDADACPQCVVKIKTALEGVKRASKDAR